MGNFRQSIASFSESIRLAPENPDGYFNRGTAYLQQGEFERAIDDFSSVIRLSPRQEAAYYRRGFAHEEAGHRREAIADFRQFLSLSTDLEAAQEVEQLLHEWQKETQTAVSSQGVLPNGQRGADQGVEQAPAGALDLYGLIVALGERARGSLWFGSDVTCRGENAAQLYAWTSTNQPIEGRDLLSIASGIRQTIQGDFYALDPGASAHWLFIRAWDGNGFYMEIDDPNGVQRLKMDLPSLEQLDGAAPPYQGLFIRVE
jgi:tetratricopeptide (TPR) repeat protein